MKEIKDSKLFHIYLKIHNKRVLTFDDLAYLAKYNPECFKKTCDNLLYKIPEADSLVNPDVERSAPNKAPAAAVAPGSIIELTADERLQIERMIIQFFDEMKEFESGDIDTLQNIDVARTKELIEELFMENIFPRRGNDDYINIMPTNTVCSFNAMA